jgi:hypothetical protein
VKWYIFILLFHVINFEVIQILLLFWSRYANPKVLFTRGLDVDDRLYFDHSCKVSSSDEANTMTILLFVYNGLAFFLTAVLALATVNLNARFVESPFILTNLIGFTFFAIVRIPLRLDTTDVSATNDYTWNQGLFAYLILFTLNFFGSKIFLVLHEEHNNRKIRLPFKKNALNRFLFRLGRKEDKNKMKIEMKKLKMDLATAHCNLTENTVNIVFFRITYSQSFKILTKMVSENVIFRRVNAIMPEKWRLASFMAVTQSLEGTTLLTFKCHDVSKGFLLSRGFKIYMINNSVIVIQQNALKIEKMGRTMDMKGFCLELDLGEFTNAKAFLAKFKNVVEDRQVAFSSANFLDYMMMSSRPPAKNLAKSSSSVLATRDYSE